MSSPQTIDLTPNYTEMFKQFRDEILPAMKNLTRTVREVLGEYGPTNPVQRNAALAQIVGKINAALYPIAIAAQSMRTPDEVKQLRDQLVEALTYVNDEFSDLEDA